MKKKLGLLTILSMMVIGLLFIFKPMVLLADGEDTTTSTDDRNPYGLPSIVERPNCKIIIDGYCYEDVDKSMYPEGYDDSKLYKKVEIGGTISYTRILTDEEKEELADKWEEEYNTEYSYVTKDEKTHCTVVNGKITICYTRNEDGKWIPTDYRPNINDMQKSTGVEYVSEQSGAMYKALTGEIKNIWDLDIKEDLKDPIAWMLDNKSYIVLKNYEGKTQVFWNVPNIQQSVINTVIREIPDGFDGGSYVVEDTEKIIPVGSHARSRNLVSNLGFYIPSIPYVGELPVVYLSVNDVLPTSMGTVAYKVIKSVIGGDSFIDAPEAETYNSMRYLGHDYQSYDENIVNFIEKYWQKYFVEQIYYSENTFIPYDNVSKDFVNADGKRMVASKHNNYKNSIGEKYVAESAKQSSQDWIVKYFPRQYDTEYKAFFTVTDANIGTPRNPVYGNYYGEDEGYDFNLNEKQIHIEDVTKAVTPQVRQIIADDKVAAITGENSIARNRCKLKSVDEHEITDKRDGVEEWNPENYKDDYWWTFEWTEAVYEGPATVTCTNCDGPYVSGYQYDYSCSSDEYIVGTSCYIDVTRSEQRFDGDAYDNDIHFWETGEGSPATKIGNEYRTPYKGLNQEINNVQECVDQYDKIYDLCVDGDSEYTSSKEEIASGNYNPKEICPIKKNTNRDIHYINYGSQKEAFYDPSVTYTHEEEASQYAREGNAQEGYRWTELVYRFDRIMNLGSYNTTTEFCSVGAIQFKLFNKEIYWDNKETNIIPSEKIIDNLGIQPLSIKQGYNKQKNTVSRFNEFMERWAKTKRMADKEPSKYIYYNQCLIMSMHHNKCEAEDGSQLSLFNIYVRGQLYKINMDPEKVDPDTHLLPTETQLHDRAIRIVEKIQSTSAQYYPMVMNNLVNTMIRVAAANGETLELEDYVSDRVLPYNRQNMVQDNADLVAVDDPRFNLSLLKNRVGGFLKNSFANVILSGTGLMAELCVQVTKWMSFKFFNDNGLSPASMWTNNLVEVVIGVLIVFFIFQLINSAMKFIKGNAALMEVIGRFVSFFFVFGLLTIVYLDPAGVWSRMQTVLEKVMTLGEQVTLRQNEAFDALFTGSGDDETIYWASYFDAWSTYNTGYTLVEAEQKLDTNSGKPEVANIRLPSNTKLWSVLLAKSFVQDDENHSLNVHNNAYRVVDHFMAPRVEVTESAIKGVTQNENYNGMFQGAVVELIPKLFATILLLLIVCVKFLTFLYLWYMLYMLLTNIMLSMNLKGYKDVRTVLRKTFMPALWMVIIGLWSGMVIYLSAAIRGLSAFIVVAGLYYVSIKLFLGWKDRFRNDFPPTLDWLYIILDWLFRGRKPRALGNAERFKNKVTQSASEMAEEDAAAVEKEDNKESENNEEEETSDES